MIRLNITRLSKRLNMNQQSENDFSTLFIVKNTPLRQLSISTRTSKQSQLVRRLPTNPNQDSQHLTSRTISAYDGQLQSLPLTEKKLSINNLPSKKKTARRLIGLQTSPNLIIKPKFTDIKYDVIDLFQLHIQEPRVLHKGKRDTSLLKRIVIIGQSVNLNKQLMMKLRSECIVVLLTNNISKIDDQFDCIMQPPHIPANEVLSFKRNNNQIWISLCGLIHSFKQPEQFIMIDEISSENIKDIQQIVNFNLPNNFVIEEFKNKILYQGNCKMLHLFIPQDKQNLSKLYYALCHLFKYDQQDLQQLNLQTILQECSERCLEINSQLLYLQQVYDIKSRLKTKYKREQINLDSPEEITDKLRNELIEYMKSRSQTRITGMYYLIGDTIMRNIQFFKNRQEDKYYKEKKHQETLLMLGQMSKPIQQASIQQSQYAFYIL